MGDIYMAKWFALLFMIIDHIGVYFEGYLSNSIYNILRLIGRLSFPLFTYFLVLGIQRTSNLKKYMIRLVIFGIISQIIINSFRGFPGKLNILFSFALYILFYILWNSNTGMLSKLKSTLIPFVILGLFFVDYSFYGFFVFLGLLMLTNVDFIKHKRITVFIILFIFSFLSGVFSNFLIQTFASFSAMFMFNDKFKERLFSPKIEKWAFYLIYPLQWIIFWIIEQSLIL